MNKIYQHIGIHKHYYWLVTILLWGLGGPVFAQTPPFSPSTLPPLPTGPSGAAPNNPTNPSAAINPAPNNPINPSAAITPVPTTPGTPSVLPDLAAAIAPPLAIAGNTALAPLPANSAATPTPASPTKNGAAPPLPLPSPLADLPPPLPESSDPASARTALPPLNNAPAPGTAEAPPPPPPDLNVPVPLLPTVTASKNAPNATALPEVNVTSEKPKRKSWETVLAPTVIPTRTRFNYRRVVQPATIYRAQYSADNSHLPPAVSREQYVALLFQRVAANDVEATRALLNAGIRVDETDGSGQTPLAIARQSGARDTAALLLARGARG